MPTKPFIDVRRGTWHGVYRLSASGKRTKKTLGKHPTSFPPSRPPKNPPKEVLDRHKKFADIEYELVNNLPSDYSEGVPLAGYILKHREAKATGCRDSTVKMLRGVTDKFLAYCKTKGINTVQGVTRAVCRDFLESGMKDGTSANSLKTWRGYLSPIWTRAEEDEIVSRNPWKFAKVPGKSEPGDPVFWTSDEVCKLIAESKPQWFADLVAVLANTGIRISACLVMKWDWIDWEKGVVTVSAEFAKGRKTYSTPLNDMTRDILTRRFAASEGDYVFPFRTDGSPPSYETAKLYFNKAVGRSGVRHGTLHDLRHTYGRTLALSGAPLNVVQAALGHSSLAMTQRYTAVTGEDGVAFMPGFSIGQNKPAA